MSLELGGGRGPLIVVGLGEMGVGRGEEVLVTYALGSCVGVALWDARAALAGLAHIFLPEGGQREPPERQGLYADRALPLLVERLVREGAHRPRLVAKIAGGANLFVMGERDGLAVGARNVAAVRRLLKELGIPLGAEAVGGRQGRTMWVHAGSGRVVLTAGGRPVAEL